MDDMRELVTVEQAEQAIRFCAVALPAAGLAVGALVGAVRRRALAGLATGLLCGLAGPAALVMWRIYNAVMGRYGLDSVRALLINLALFATVGVIVGLTIGCVARRRRAKAARPDTSASRLSS